MTQNYLMNILAALNSSSAVFSPNETCESEFIYKLAPGEEVAARVIELDQFEDTIKHIKFREHGRNMSIAANQIYDGDGFIVVVLNCIVEYTQEDYVEYAHYWGYDDYDEAAAQHGPMTATEVHISVRLEKNRIKHGVNVLAPYCWA